MNKQWWNLSPRGGFAWDVHGDGRLAVRSSYAMALRLHVGRIPQHRRERAAVRQPFAADDRRAVRRSVSAATTRIRSSPMRTRRTCRSARSARWIPASTRRVSSRGTDARAAARHATGASSVSLSRQPLRSAVGADGAQPRRVHGARAVHDQRRQLSASARPTTNLNQRRTLYQVRTRRKRRSSARSIRPPTSAIQNYRGVKFAAQRRAANGLSLNGNYTLSECKGDADDAAASTRRAPATSSRGSVVRRGDCDQDRRHICHGDARLRDARGWQRRRARARLALACVGHPQRALGQPSEHQHRASTSR